MSVNFFALFCLPLTLAVLSLVLNSVGFTRKLVAVASWVQMAVVAHLFWPLLTGHDSTLTGNSDFVVDRLGAYFILLTTFVIACSITHADCFFAGEESHQQGADDTLHLKMFYCCVSLFLASMCFVFISNNLGFLWIGIEATTLFSAPLVYFDRTKNALEATWKYFIVCSVGIALALLGTVFFFASSQHGTLASGSLNITELIAHASELNYSLLRLGFIFCLLGYGTKAGMFPLHSWLPDAHSEAPAPASAMLSGALLNCALFGIWRVSAIAGAAHHSVLMNQMLVAMGAITVVAAAVFLIRQHSFKRMWAYSSIENVGIMLVAIGLGSAPLYFLQALNHSLAKVALFLLSGNIVQACGAKRLHNLHGIMKVAPLWGCLLALATFAVTGAPPFGSFVSELSILATSASIGNWYLVSVLVLSIALAFVAVSTHVGRVLFGGPKGNFHPSQTIRTSIIPGVLILGAVIMGVMVRPGFFSVLR